jgi:hypothetical protein
MENPELTKEITAMLARLLALNDMPFTQERREEIKELLIEVGVTMIFAQKVVD